MVLIAQVGRLRPSGTISGITQDDAVATGVRGSAADSSHTPQIRRLAYGSTRFAMTAGSSDTSLKPRTTAWKNGSNRSSLDEIVANRKPFAARFEAATESIGASRKAS